MNRPLYRGARVLVTFNGERVPATVVDPETTNLGTALVELDEPAYDAAGFVRRVYRAWSDCSVLDGAAPAPASLEPAPDLVDDLMGDDPPAWMLVVVLAVGLAAIGLAWLLGGLS